MPLCAACCLKIRKYCFDAKFSSEIVFCSLKMSRSQCESAKS
jgi:hypothetical protein